MFFAYTRLSVLTEISNFEMIIDPGREGAGEEFPGVPGEDDEGVSMPLPRMAEDRRDKLDSPSADSIDAASTVLFLSYLTTVVALNFRREPEGLAGADVDTVGGIGTDLCLDLHHGTKKCRIRRREN
jgi:hypothetical protein